VKVSPTRPLERPEPLLVADKLAKHFSGRRKLLQPAPPTVRAVDDVSLSIAQGETLALVGESGSGKSTLGRLMIRLIEPTAGRVLHKGKDIFAASHEDMRLLRRKMQIIFQDPYSSLNPRMTVEQTIGDPLVIHRLGGAAERRERVRAALRSVELHEEHAERYPHEFSGGQRQRIGIARALVLEPDFVVCDEPVSALDVSIQAQIINLLRRIQEERGLSYLFISHNLGVVRHIADRVAVMYLGSIVEIAEKTALYGNPLHPYTRALLSAILEPNPELRGSRIALHGEPPSPHEPPSGCRFRLQCPLAQQICAEEAPPLRRKASPAADHRAACHFVADAPSRISSAGEAAAPV
jgi:oligopeptide transport system ATP-binding protein